MVCRLWLGVMVGGYGWGLWLGVIVGRLREVGCNS